MADLAESFLDKVKVKSTRPAAYLPVSARAPHETARLVLRSFTDADLESYHRLRSQPEVMIFTSQGRPDADLVETQAKLDLFTSPRGDEMYVLAVVAKDTGELVGTAGSHLRLDQLGWPCLGYMLCKEAWGKGYATEMVRGFLDVYWALPREEAVVELDVDTTTVPEGQKQAVAAAAALADPAALVTIPEQITAITLDSNVASQNVLLKSGFKLVKKWIDTENAPLLPMIYGWTLEKPQ